MKKPYSDAQFGVHGGPVPRMWAAITNADLLNLARTYTVFNASPQIVVHSPRPFSSACIVETGGQTFFVKRHDMRVKTAEALLREHDMIHWLHSNGALVDKPIHTRFGSSAAQRDRWIYEVFPMANGFDLYRETHSWDGWLSDTQALSAGAALGRLHTLLTNYSAPPRQGALLTSKMSLLRAADFKKAYDDQVRRLICLKPCLEQQTLLIEARDIYVQFYEALRPMLPLFAPCWGHGDWHGSNLMWSDQTANAEVSTIFDFGMAERTACLFDLAVALERSMITWLQPNQRDWKVRWSHLDAFMQGYVSKKPLRRLEYAALSAILPLVHVEFAFSEIRYYSNIVKDYESADVALTRYLVEHGQWMAGVEGATLRHDIAHSLPNRMGCPA